MSNCNDYAFAKHMDQFKIRILDPQIKKVNDAQKIVDNKNYPWESPEQKKMGEARLEQYKQWLGFYQNFYDEGIKLCVQHENLVNKTAKWYGRWYNEVSNEGHQETEIMSMQADALNEIFSEIYKELLPLKLDLKQPKALNLK